MFVWRLCWVINLPIDLSISPFSVHALSLSPFIQLSYWWPADPLWLLGVVAGAGARVARGWGRRRGDDAPGGHQHRAAPGEAVERGAELPAAAGSAGRWWGIIHTHTHSSHHMRSLKLCLNIIPDSPCQHLTVVSNLISEINRKQSNLFTVYNISWCQTFRSHCFHLSLQMSSDCENTCDHILNRSDLLSLCYIYNKYNVVKKPY